MTNPIHIMLDLETWGKTPGSDLRSIGACVFIPHTGAVCTAEHIQTQPDYPNGTFYLATSNPVTGAFMGGLNMEPSHGVIRKYDLDRDPETVKWWSDQSAEAQAAFANPIDLKSALHAFADWLHHVSGRIDLYSPGVNYVAPQQIALWSHGPAFDVSILDAAYRAVDLPTPWHYRAPRDTRTAFDMADVGDHSAFMQRFNYGTAHNALDDAISQAGAVCEAYRIVRGWKQGHDDNEADLNRPHTYAP